MKRNLKLPEKVLVFEVFKVFILQLHGRKKRNIPTEAPLPPMCSDKYLNC